MCSIGAVRLISDHAADPILVAAESIDAGRELNCLAQLVWSRRSRLTLTCLMFGPLGKSSFKVLTLDEAAASFARSTMAVGLIPAARQM